MRSLRLIRCISCRLNGRQISSLNTNSSASNSNRVRSVLVYGDSNTWGYDPQSSSGRSSNHRFPYQHRWTTICQNLLGPSYHIIAEGLNNRTTVYSDEISTEGEYDCNGRATLAATLHTHKPLDIVVLALGANDLKSKFSATSRDIAIGVRILVKDIEHYQNLGHFVSQDLQRSSSPLVHMPPKILLVGPPIIQLTALNKLWGFPDDVTAKAKRLSNILLVLCKELGIEYIDLGNLVPPSPQDGVHYSLDDQPTIAQLVTDKLLDMTGDRYESQEQ